MEEPCSSILAVFEDGISKEDAEIIADAIMCLKGIISVDVDVENREQYTARRKAVNELEKRIEQNTANTLKRFR